MFFRLIACCRDFKKYGPLKKGPRKKCIEIIFTFFASVLLIIFGCWTTVKEVDVNYTYYLGPDYKQKMKPIKKTSTVIANHISFLDGPVLSKAIFPAFAPSIEFSTFPIVSTILNTLDSIYMPRGGTEEAKKQAIDAIRER